MSAIPNCPNEPTAAVTRRELLHTSGLGVGGLALSNLIAARMVSVQGPRLGERSR